MGGYMGGIWDLDFTPNARLPQGFCGMEGVEEQLEYEQRQREDTSRSTSLESSSVPELLRELARKLEAEKG